MGSIRVSLQSGLLNQSSAQVIDGSLKFNETSGSYLTRTPSSNGNRRTWTWSCWCKIAKLPVSGTNGDRTLFSAVDTSNGGDDDAIRFIRSGITGGQSLYWSSSEYNVGDEEAIYTNAVLRDPNAFYHVVLIKDTTQSSLANGQMRMYINGVEQSLVESNAISQNAERAINSQIPHAIGDHYGQDRPWDGMMTQVYLIDGLTLGPGYFGFTDPLTNTWRPRKFKAEGTTVNDGTVWSGGTVTGGAGNGSGSGGWTQAFDGNTSNLVYPTDSNGSTKIVLPKPIRFVSNVRLYAGQNATSGTDILVNGINLSNSLSFPLSGGWLSIDHLITSPITSLEIKNVGGQASNIRALEVDGAIVTDSTTTNLDFGTNGFYLPMDGNSPIGDDKSGKGNNWTPVKFGGSLELGNPNVSGARSILNTDGGGNVARPGVFGSEVGAYYAVTVASVGGGNRYHFDGVDRPNPTLTRGATYTFDQSDSSNSNHPLRFATAADAAGSSQYTDGVTTNGTPGSAGAYTKITVPHNSPNTLHYYCTNHGGMGSSTSQTTDETKADPYAWKCVLAAPLSGSEGGTTINEVHNLIKGSGSAKAISIYTGSTSGGAVTSGANSQYYGSSFYVVRGPTNNYSASDYIYRTGDTDLAFGTGDFTVEFWYYPTSFVSNSTIFDNRHPTTNWPSSTNGFQFYSNASGNLNLRTGSGSIIAASSVIGVEMWHHLVITRSSGTIRLFVNGVEIGSASNSNDFNEGRFHLGSAANNGEGSNGYYADLRIYKGVSKYTSNFVVPATSPDILPDTPSGVSGGSKLTKVTDGAVSFDGTGDYLSLADSDDIDLTGSISFTVEAFIYKTDSAEDQIFEFRGGGSTGWTLYTTTSNTLQIYDSVANTQVGTSTGKITPNAWNHIALTKNGSGSNNCDFWINGVNSGTFSLASFATTDSTGLRIGASKDTSAFFTGFMSNVRILKGTAVYTSDFTPPTAPLTNVTNTKLLCCQSNTSATEGAVKPGSITANGNAAATTLNPFTTDIDAVRGQESGYCTINPLDGYVSTKDGNLETSTSSGWQSIRATLGMNSGKFYWETQNNQDAAAILGIADSEATGFVDGSIFGSTGHGGGDANPAYTWAGANYYFNATTAGTGLSNHVPSDVVQYAFDADSGKLWFGRNGVWYNSSWGTTGNPAGGSNATVSGINTTKTYLACASFYNGSAKFNFGQKPFKFPPPTGFQPLNAASVRPETVITRPDQYFGTTLYTGTGATQSINASLKSDFVWIKNRSSTYEHLLFDTVRGSTKYIKSNSVALQQTNASTLSSFNINGFTLGGDNEVNKSSETYVAWTWRAGGAPIATNDNTSGAMDSNSVSLDGVLQSAYVPSGSPTLYPKKMSIGTRQGFSIMEYEGPGSAKSLPHGLNSAPEFIMVKRLDVNASWALYHVGLGNTKVIELNDSGSPNTSSSVWNSTTPTSSVWSIGNYADTGDSGGDYVAYLWHSVPGLQKFGTYVGNASTDGTFVELGFRPRWIMQKNISGQEWFIHDTARDPINVAGFRLTAESNVAENGTKNTWLDILSNGFKFRTTNEAGNSGTFIYMAWAEAPTFNLYGGQSNAR